MKTGNGRQVGAKYLATFNAFLSSGGLLPVSSKDGTLNLTELSQITGIPTTSFYQNPKIKEQLESARLEQGLSRFGDGRTQEACTAPTSVSSSLPERKSNTAPLERRIQGLEQQNAVLAAEVFELRRQLKALRLQFGREDMVIETGRRIPAPSGSA